MLFCVLFFKKKMLTICMSEPTCFLHSILHFWIYSQWYIYIYLFSWCYDVPCVGIHFLIDLGWLQFIVNTYNDAVHISFKVSLGYNLYIELLDSRFHILKIWLNVVKVFPRCWCNPCSYNQLGFWFSCSVQT